MVLRHFGEEIMKAAFYTLGCKVNQYETETIREQFRKDGFDIVPDNVSADVYVVNTCTVTNLADRKSRQYIRKAHRLNPDAVICVTGCYAQVDEESVASIEGVSIVAGTDSKSRILEDVKKELKRRSEQSPHGQVDLSEIYRDVKPYSELNKYEELGVITEMEGRTRAFIKIQEGCDRFCSYCIIPFARGKVRSRARDEITAEVKGLVEKGYKEIVLTGINTALYGVDLGYGGIAPLIESINGIEGDFRIRLSSLEPTVIDSEYAVDLLKYDKLCHHLHLSAQSGSDSVLAAMNRHYTRDDYLDIVHKLREKDPSFGISADVIVGFPGETEEDFSDSIDLVKKSELVKTHVFKYSKRKGTKACDMQGQVEESNKAERSARLLETAEIVREDFIRKCCGEKRRVLFEQEEHGMITGYTDNYIKIFAASDEASDLIGEFAYVRVGEPYLDGARGTVVHDFKEI